MAVFKSKPFARFCRKNGISDERLCQVAIDLTIGRVDADLGGGVIKQRIARSGRGKSGGYRAIVLFRSGAHVFFVYGFARSTQSNISRSELLAFRDLAGVMLKYSDNELDVAQTAGELFEVQCSDQE